MTSLALIELAATLVAGSGLGFVGGWQARERVPVRIPTNATRIEDAETDVKVAESHLKRREISYKGEAMDIRAGMALEGLRRTAAEYDPVPIDPGKDGTDELVSMLIKARGEKGLTQTGLAQIAQISEKRLRGIFGGDSPTVEELHKLAQALDLHLESPELSRPAPPKVMLPAIPETFTDDAKPYAKY